MTTDLTCTVRFATGLCGKPAVTTFTGRNGEVYAECAEHTDPSVPAKAVHTVILKTRSGAPYALVRGTEIVGYAHSASSLVKTRCLRLGAKLLPIEAGKVIVEVTV